MLPGKSYIKTVIFSIKNVEDTELVVENVDKVAKKVSLTKALNLEVGEEDVEESKEEHAKI